jgi:hypothetical protein
VGPWRAPPGGSASGGGHSLAHVVVIALSSGQEHSARILGAIPYLLVLLCPEPTILTAVADLIASGSSTSGVDSVVTFNFDELLETELAARKIAVRPVISKDGQRGRGLRVIHPRGYIPRSGRFSRDNVIFTEPDYHKLTEAVFHWGLSEIVDCLRTNTVLFIGLSMSDPSLRRLLDATRPSRLLR